MSSRYGTNLDLGLFVWRTTSTSRYTEAGRRLRSTSSMSLESLDVRRTRQSTVGDRAFPVAAARLWNSLPSHVTAVPSLSIFWCRLKSHLLTFLSRTLSSSVYFCCRAIQEFMVGNEPEDQDAQRDPSLNRGFEVSRMEILDLLYA